MTQHRRAEVHVTCDAPGCRQFWHHADEREHVSGRDPSWMHVTVYQDGRSLNLDFCPAHAPRQDVILRALVDAAERG